MKRIVLFSTPTPTNINKILEQIFPEDLKDKVLAYMPSDGSNAPQKYIDEWKGYAERNNSGSNLVNNSLIGSTEEYDKLLRSNILVISGGNTFKLLDNLRKSGLDKAISVDIIRLVTEASNLGSEKLIILNKFRNNLVSNCDPLGHFPSLKF